MLQTQTRQSTGWTWLNIAVILSSTVIALYPPARHAAIVVIPFGLVLTPIYFIAMVRRERAAGRGNVALGELYQQVKAGRRLRQSPLELAAVVSFVLAVATMV